MRASLLTRYGQLEPPDVVSTLCSFSVALPQYTPQSIFTSERTGIKLELTDSYIVRNDIAATLHKNAENWLHLAVSRAPFEVQAIMQVCPKNLRCI